MKLRRLAALTGALALLGFSGCIPDSMMPKARKPVLYLYPPEETTVTVSLSLDGELTCAYPAMEEGGWTVTARPDGALVDEAGREYPYLFWEGILAAKWDFSSGFVVEGSRTADFLEEKLALLGLTDREAADLITYWLPPYGRKRLQSHCLSAGYVYAGGGTLHLPGAGYVAAGLHGLQTVDKGGPGAGAAIGGRPAPGGLHSGGMGRLRV